MTQEHLEALLKEADTKKDSDGWLVTPEGRQLTLYASHNGASLSVSRVEAIREDAGLVKAKTVRGELFVLALDDVFAGAVEGPKSSSRKAGFVS